jgi:hypothetical protein
MGLEAGVTYFAPIYYRCGDAKAADEVQAALLHQLVPTEASETTDAIRRLFSTDLFTLKAGHLHGIGPVKEWAWRMALTSVFNRDEAEEDIAEVRNSFGTEAWPAVVRRFRFLDGFIEERHPAVMRLRKERNDEALFIEAQLNGFEIIDKDRRINN